MDRRRPCADNSTPPKRGVLSSNPAVTHSSSIVISLSLHVEYTPHQPTHPQLDPRGMPLRGEEGVQAAATMGTAAHPWVHGNAQTDGARSTPLPTDTWEPHRPSTKEIIQPRVDEKGWVFWERASKGAVR
jgi:hypothetical protein